MHLQREPYACANTHWPQEEKKKKDLRMEGPPHHHHPPPATPPTVQIPRVYTCVLMGGGVSGLEKGGNVPIRSLLNTFVSTARRDTHYRQAAARRRRRRRRCSEGKRLSRQNVLLLLVKRGKKKKKENGRMEGVFP